MINLTIFKKIRLKFENNMINNFKTYINILWKVVQSEFSIGYI
jgi:hypothetical protein